MLPPTGDAQVGQIDPADLGHGVVLAASRCWPIDCAAYIEVERRPNFDSI